MRPEARKFLFDIQSACKRLRKFTAGKNLNDYRSEDLLRSAVERQFEIIGEAISQLSRLDPELVSRVSEHRRIIAFRNILIHGYAIIDDAVVWDIVESKLPTLAEEIAQLLVS